MTGLNDEIGRIVSEYLRRDARHAELRLRDDLSCAVGRANWPLVRTLQRASLRLQRLRAVYRALWF